MKYLPWYLGLLLCFSSFHSFGLVIIPLENDVVLSKGCNPLAINGIGDADSVNDIPGLVFTCVYDPRKSHRVEIGVLNGTSNLRLDNIYWELNTMRTTVREPSIVIIFMLLGIGVLGRFFCKACIDK